MCTSSYTKYDHRVSLSTHKEVKKIAKCFSDAKVSFKILKNGIQAEGKVRKVRKRIEYLESLKDSKVGTPEIESLAKGIVFPNSPL